MTERALVGADAIRPRVDVRLELDSRPDIPALNSLALHSLLSLFDEREKLFSTRAIAPEAGFRHGKVSGRLSAIALLGLDRLEASGATCPIDVPSTKDAVWRDRSWVKGIGDLGLLTWFTSVCFPDHLEDLFREYDFGKAVANYADAREGRTTELAWFLAGTSHARIACPNTPIDLTDVAVETYHLLGDNQSDSGIFGHAAFPGFLARSIRNRFGTFADQIHTIYALATFARAFQIEEPLAPALSCANSIRALQGEMGQWWFLYDKRSCRVVNRYPVLSVNQDGLAPLGLQAVEELTGQSFQESIDKGLLWIAGKNELGEDLRDRGHRVIWDSIGPARLTPNFWEAALSVLNISPGPPPETLRVRHETRPDHFAWLLCAFGNHGLPKTMSAAASARSR